MTGINHLSCIPIRSEPSDKAEMVNQVLYGETFEVLEKAEKWSKIKLHHDHYEGWIDNKQYKTCDMDMASGKKKGIVSDKFLYRNNHVYPMGSMVDFEVTENMLSIQETAAMFSDTPYLWGGRTFMGIDCSGFTQVVFRVHHISLLRNAWQQETQGETVSLADAATNDLAFFSNDKGRVVHVGIILKENGTAKIIHASGQVRTDSLDENGILQQDGTTYTHRLHSIKRILRHD